MEKEFDNSARNLELEAENRLIVNRIKGILLRNMVNISDPSGPILDFHSPHNQITVALAAITKDWEDRIVDELWFTVPPGLTFLSYCLKIEPITKKETIERMFTSVHGNLPSRIIGSDNYLYEIENAYLFDSNGKAVKIERITRAHDDDQSLDEVLNSSGYSEEEKERIKRVNFIPIEEGDNMERTVPLSSGDYEQVFYYLDKIDSGEYKPIQYRLT